MLGAMFGLGFILGPVMGGLLGAIDLHLPFFVAGGLALLNLLYGYFVLPESLPPERRRPFDWKSRQSGDVAARAGAAARASARWSRWSPAAALAQFILYTSWVLYTTFKFGWGPLENGWSLFAVGVDVGARAGRAARPAAEALLAAAAGGAGAGLVDARLRRLGRRHRGLDDVRGHRRQRARLRRRRVDPEHHLQRRRPDARRARRWAR